MCENHTKSNHTQNKDQSKKRWGSALEHGEAHTKDHNNWSRRNFLRSLGITGSGAIMLGGTPVVANSFSSLANALGNTPGDRILVLIRLKGGNDGLNTIVPVYAHDHYKYLRPTIGFERNEIRNLDDKFGMPKFMDDVYPLWQEGKMKVINSVGYEDQNLSHFRSSDIWSSASEPDVQDASGWLGRYIVSENPDYQINPPEAPPAIQIGGLGSSVFNDQELINLAMVVTKPEDLAKLAEDGELFDTTDVPDCFMGEQLRFLRAMTNNTFTYAGVIEDAYKSAQNDVNYTGAIATEMALIARMIKGGLGTRIYMVTLDGFDTHANQIDAHRELLTSITSGIKSFFDDLSVGGRDKDVLCMTFSEFGRRIEQNDSNGTDHGAAAPLLLFGEGLNGNGFYGANPNLNDVDRSGNLKHDIDFRQIYSTVLTHWLCVDPTLVDGVMGNNFEDLDIGLTCLSTSTNRPPFVALKHEVRYQDRGQVRILYNLSRTANVNVTVFDLLGQPIETLVNRQQLSGPQEVQFNSKRHRLPGGMYLYRINVDGQLVSGKMRLY